ncbi:BTB/POZ domain protein [Rhizoctonia solani 123E]|uniref:BTB/POZ domain protein n=1 Tax=Rhizoctonia solani 123E TaxID=1423351 RepID=A0A074RYN6_9AGAM|nr:BTB/POZ domain protein [Rhizoctonia solani 123E]
MSSDSPAESVGAESPFVFQPPAGGDLTLQSCDGTKFQVHSVLLGLASTVFADMLVGSTKSDAVELAEDAETISLMLAFIYPVDPPSITTVDRLEKVMLSSQKYDIEKLTKYIENPNRWDSQLIHSDPIRVLRASAKHGFPTIQALSAKRFGLKVCDYRSSKGLEELATLLPEYSCVIGLLGAALAREEILRGDAQTDLEKTHQPFTFQPPSGGDLVLKSCDNTIFHAHSLILGMASTVFSDMFAGATDPDAVELAEDAEAISIMLAFIYPIPTPQITTVALLEKAMVCAQKYHIERMLKFIEERVYLGSDLLSLDPVRIYCTSVKHNYRTIQILAAKSINRNDCDFFSVEGLLRLAQYFPEAAPAIGLVGAQGARAGILFKILVQTPREYGIYPKGARPPPTETTVPFGRTATSTKAIFLPMCRSHTPQNNVAIVPSYCKPWLLRLHDELMKKPTHQCDATLRINSLVGMGEVNHAVCDDCIISAFEDHQRFERWAQDVKRIVEKELKELDVLYSL